MRLRVAQAAKLFVVDELVDRRLLAAHRAATVALEVKRIDLVRQRIEAEKLADERLALAEDQLDRLQRLDRSDEAREDSQYAGLGAGRRHVGRRRLGVKAPIARPLARIENR